MPRRTAAFALIAAGALAACAWPPPHPAQAADTSCTDSYVGSRLCDSNGGPDTGNAFHNPAVGMDMPTHPR